MEGNKQSIPNLSETKRNIQMKDKNIFIKFIIKFGQILGNEWVSPIFEIGFHTLYFRLLAAILYLSSFKYILNKHKVSCLDSIKHLFSYYCKY